MFKYFGYGSNINLLALRAKGVEPIHSTHARLHGWKLAFNVRHWFPLEGGMGNIIPTGNRSDIVEGVVHTCPDEHLARLDALEAYGIGYDRVLVDVTTSGESVVQAYAYVGMPDAIDDSCLPTRRYINIIVSGAVASGISEEYIEQLRKHPLHVFPTLERFEAPLGDFPTYTESMLAQSTHLTALCGYVFDMRGARRSLDVPCRLFGGVDTTLFHLHRHDTSNGTETMQDVRAGTISQSAADYLNAYLHEYNREFRFAGRLASE